MLFQTFLLLPLIQKKKKKIKKIIKNEKINLNCLKLQIYNFFAEYEQFNKCIYFLI